MSGSSVQEQALYLHVCMHAAMFAWARTVDQGLVSGSRQHMPDTALWGPAFIPCCFHSPTFARCTRKCFLKSSHSSKKKKKSASIYFYTHLDCGLSFDTQHFSIMQRGPKKCAPFLHLALSRSGTRDKQTNCSWSFIKHIFPGLSFISEIYIYLGH